MVLPEPRAGGGVPGTGRLLAHGLASLGHEVDAYAVVDRPESVALLEGHNLRPVVVDTRWRWNQWYSQSSRPMIAHLTQLATRAVAARTLARDLEATHRSRAYDVVYRFSTIELLGLGRRASLPPIVVHAEVHAAGELTALRRERPLARAAESPARRWMAELLMQARVPRQRSALQSVAGVIAPSRVFAAHLERDCGLESSSVYVAPNPVDLDAFAPVSQTPERRGPWRLVFIGRISVRKGIDQLIELSHRLGDLAGHVRLEIIGGPTLWSDYRSLLHGLDPAIASFRGLVSHDALPQRLASYDGLLQPSTYEPFAITVAEGLAAGVPVVATDEVGAAEDVDAACCTIVPAGRVDSLEAAVRDLVRRLDDGERPKLARTARAEAERLFAPARAASLVADALQSAVRSQTASYPVR